MTDHWGKALKMITAAIGMILACLAVYNFLPAAWASEVRLLYVFILVIFFALIALLVVVNGLIKEKKSEKEDE